MEDIWELACTQTKLCYFFVSFIIVFIEEEEVEDDEGDANQDEFMKAQQAKLAEEKQKLLQNHDMVESVRILLS